MRHRNNGKAGRRGFTLIELLVVVVLLAAVAGLGGEAFVESIRATRAANKSLSSVQVFDAMVLQIRRDMWNAESAAAREGARVTIKQSGGRSITWERGEDGTITRQEGDEVATRREWKGLAAVNFEVQGAVLRVTIVDGRENVVTDLPSQILLAGGQK